jgi:hypothetical protein
VHLSGWEDVRRCLSLFGHLFGHLFGPLFVHGPAPPFRVTGVVAKSGGWSALVSIQYNMRLMFGCMIDHLHPSCLHRLVWRWASKRGSVKVRKNASSCPSCEAVRCNAKSSE